MARPVELNELDTFMAVAEQGNFSRAASRLGVSPPRVSLMIRTLEERLGVRLFNRSTRSVALTEAGARLLLELEPALLQLREALETVNLFRDKPAGALRLAVGRPFATHIVAPLLQAFLSRYPEIEMEVFTDDSRTDIVRCGLDAGIRVGYQVERGMTTLQLADAFRMIAVAAPSYLVANPPIKTPRDLLDHNCILSRVPWDGGLMPWRFSQLGGPSIEVAVRGSLTVNDAHVMLQCVLSGIGVGYIPEPLVTGYLTQNALVNLFTDWSGWRTGIFLYHPSRRQLPAPLDHLVKFLGEQRAERTLW